MPFPRYIRTVAMLGLSCGPLWLAAQAPRQNWASRPGTASAQGELMVTLTVVASVGIVIDGDGEPRLVVANAADAKDNVSSIRRVQLAPVRADSQARKSRQRSRNRASEQIIRSTSGAKAQMF